MRQAGAVHTRLFWNLLGTCLQVAGTNAASSKEKPIEYL
jgi:hypothetical protein